jgi:hypothetical protein
MKGTQMHIKANKNSLLNLALLVSVLTSSVIKAESIFDSCYHAAQALGAGAASLASAGLSYKFLNDAQHYLKRSMSTSDTEQEKNCSFNSATAATLGALTAYGTYKLARHSYQSATQSSTTTLLTGLAAFYGYQTIKKHYKKHGSLKQLVADTSSRIHTASNNTISHSR